MSKVRTMPITKWLMLTMVAFITFGTLFIYHEDAGLNVEANSYESVQLPMQIPTAYNDYLANESLGNESEAATSEIDRILKEHYGNAGVLVGPRDNSTFSSVIGTLHHPNSISLTPDDLNSMGLDSDAKKHLRQYYAFGRAVHELSDRGKGMTSSSTNAMDSLDTVANTATGISRAGMKILIDYSPGPLIKQMYTGERATAVADSNFVEADGTVMVPGQKLINLVEGNVIGELWEALSIKPLGNNVPVTLTTLLLAVLVILLVVGSIIMTIFGGRAGESIKKALVRVVVASVAIPLMGMFLHWGLVGAASVTDYHISQEERDARHQIGQHLNLAGWASTGFKVPNGLDLEIKNGKFSLSQSDIRILNIMSYYVKIGGAENMGTLTKAFLEGVPDDAAHGFNAIDIYNDMQSTAKDDKNKTKPHFTMRTNGDAVEIASIASIIGSAGSPSGDDDDEEGEEAETDSSKISYIQKSNMSNTMSGSGSTYTVHGGDGIYGISPISAHHMFYSDFTGNSIKTLRSPKSYTTVVYHASNGQGGTNADGSESGTGMNGLVKFIAIMTVSIASLKGLGQIVMGGFGGLISGTARSSVGSSAGFGQAIGGVVALVGGVIGMSFIINISFELLDALYDIIKYLFKDTDGADVMAPIADAIKDVMPWGFGWVGDAFASVASFVVSLIAFLALPKFGAIPIDMFSAKMAELPGNLADRAQQMENRFTGDFRGGGGGGGGSRVGSSVGAALRGGTGQAKGIGQAGLAGLGVATGLAGMGISKVANRNSKEGDKNDSLSLNDTNENPDGTGAVDGGGIGQAVENESTVEQENADTTIAETDTTNEQDGADQLQETEQENATLQEGAEMMHDMEHEAITDDSHDIENTGDDVQKDQIQNTDQEQSMEQQMESEHSTDHTAGANDSMSHDETQKEQIQNTDQEQSVDKEVASEHTAGANDSISQENSELNKEGGDHNTTKEGGTSDTTKESIQQSNQEQSMDNQSTADMSSTSDMTNTSDNKSLSDKQVDSKTSEKSNTQNTNTSSNTNTSPNDKVGDNPAGTSVSGDGTTPTSNTSTDGSSGTGSIPSDNASLHVDGGPTPTKTSQNTSVRNENKTANQTSNEATASSSIGGDTHIDGKNDSVGESLGAATGDKGNSPGQNDTSKTGEKQNAPLQTRGQKMAGAMKRVVNKDNGRKTLDAVGKGMQAAGGKVSAKRFGAAVLHAGASTVGLQDHTKTTLDRASGKVPTQQEQQQDQKDNKQQAKQKTQDMNAQMFHHIQQQEDEARRQRVQNKGKR